MKIIDEQGLIITDPDLTLGHLVNDTEAVEHPAIEGVTEQSHYETIAEYPNGGKDVHKVIDVPGVQAKPAWVEHVPIQKYVLYTAEELAQIAEQQKQEQELEEKKQLTNEFNDNLPEMMADYAYSVCMLELNSAE